MGFAKVWQKLKKIGARSALITSTNLVPIATMKYLVKVNARFAETKI